MRTHSMRLTLLTGLATALLLVGTTVQAQDTGEAGANAGDTGAAGSATGTTAPGAKSTKSKKKKGGTGKVTDAQIFGILNAANTGEISLANLAQSTSTNDNVKQMAANMAKDHQSLNDQGTQLAQKLNITAEDSPISDQLKKIVDQQTTKLQSLTGAAFDKAYVNGEVATHQKVLHIFDKTLIPDAQNAELKAMLKKARPVIAEHLQHAKHMQTELKKGTKTAMHHAP